MALAHESIVDLYERHAQHFDHDRTRVLHEKSWLDRFLSHVPPTGTVLDIGCGMGEPIAAYLIARGRNVVGVDSSASLIELCRSRFPECEWHVLDMRELNDQRRFDGILAWDSFFHLRPDDQRAMFARFAAHALPGAPLMFTTGTSLGEAIGEYRGEPLYHGSLAPLEYRQLVAAHGFSVREHVEGDPDCGAHTVWLATYHANE